MRRLLWLMIGVVLALSASGQTRTSAPGLSNQAPRATQSEQVLADKLISIEKSTWQLWKAKDKAKFADLLADDFVAIDAHGIANKSENVQEIDNLVKHEYNLSDFQVRRIKPDVVLILYRARLKGSYKGQAFEGEYYVSSEWAKRSGRWLNVLYQETVAR